MGYVSFDYIKKERSISSSKSRTSRLLRIKRYNFNLKFPIAKFSPAYKNKWWDGKIYLFNVDTERNLCWSFRSSNHKVL
jgi:hypothetical protein